MTTEQSALSTVQVFISHVHEDNAHCEPLLLALDAWDVDYWFDKTSMRPGDAISAEIHNALIERSIFIRICTASMQHRPRWVQIETDMFLGLKAQEDGTERRGSRRFISLIMDAGFKLDKLARDFAYVDAYNKPPRVWLREMRAALGLSVQRETTKIDVQSDGVPKQTPDAPQRSKNATLLYTPEEASQVVARLLESVEAHGRSTTERIVEREPAHPELVLVDQSLPQSFAIEIGETIIERMPDDRLHLSDRTVSRRQATIMRAVDGTCTIRDGVENERSMNGTFVNGERVGETGHMLRDGDQILVGRTVLRFTLTP